MSELRPVFGEIMEDYLSQLGERWDQIDTQTLGVGRKGGAIEVPLYGRVCRVTPEGIDHGQEGLLGHTIGVLLSKYLLGPYSPPGPVEDRWVSFREFPGSAPFQQGFVDTVERRLAAARPGDLAGLTQAMEGLGGVAAGHELSYDLALVMPGLPRVPLLLLFNDEEEGFPAQATVLFRPDAQVWLDMECIAMVGIAMATMAYPGRGW